VSEVLLGQSYYLRFDPKLWAAMQPYPPLGTMYAASYLRQRGHEVALFDAVLADSEMDWTRALDRESPRFAVLYEDNFNYLSKMCLLRMREAAFAMIQSARGRGCTVIVAGSDATDHAPEFLAQGADFVLIGEGEITLGELVDRLTDRTDTPLDSINGLAFRGSSNGPPVVFTPRRPEIKELDALPFPAWDLVDVARYRDIWLQHHGYYSMNVVTSRGCSFHCNWCAKPIWGQRHNARNPQNVVAEIKWLHESYHPDHLWIADDIMGLEPGWIRRFADAVEPQQFRTPFKSLHRADLLILGDTVQSLRRAGAKTIWIGAESGSQKILDAMDKGVRVEQIYEATRRLHAAGIEVAFFLQFGYPGETREDIEMTFQMVRDCRPDDIGVAVTYPLPGTRFYDAVKQELGAKQNWVDSSDLAMMYRGPFSTAFYRQLHTVLHTEYRARKAWWSLKEMASRPQAPRLRHLRGVARLIYHAARLPLARARLERLARTPHQGLGPLPQSMAPEEAARPSAQH